MNIKTIPHLLCLALLMASSSATAALRCDQLWPKRPAHGKVSLSAKQLFLKHKQSEELQGVNPPHQTQFLIHRSSQNEAIQTEQVILIFHGLMNSPRDMKFLAQDLHALGHNVLSARLDGHFERRRNELDFVKFQDWIAQLEGYMQMARELGKKVVVLGHSTGGLASLHTSLQSDVDKIILLAPALKTRASVDALTYTTSFLGLSGWVLDPLKPNGNDRYSSSHAGVEVDRWGNLLRDTSGEEITSGDYALVRERLSEVPMLWFDTAIDRLVDPLYNLRMASQIPKTDHVFFEASDNVRHNFMAIPQMNSQYKTMLERIRNFLLL